MRAFLVQAKLFSPFAMRRFDDLAFACVPLSPLTRPSLVAVITRRGKHHCTILLCPVLVALASLKACIGQIWPPRWLAHHRQARSGKGAIGQKVFGIRLLLGRSWCDGVASQHALWVNRTQDMEAIVPAQAVREAGGSNAVEPAWPNAFVVAHGHAHTIEVSAHKRWVNLPGVAAPRASASIDPSRR